MIKFLLSLLLFVGGLPAQQGCTLYGTGAATVLCPVPLRINQVNYMMVTYNLNILGANAILYVGPRATQIYTPCGDVLVDPLIMVGSTAGGNICQYNMYLPNDPSLIGTPLYTQWVVTTDLFRTGCGPNTFTSNGAVFIIQ